MRLMRATLYGQVTKPAAIFSGTWDPILPEHIQIIRRLVNHARGHELAAVLVILEPAPASFVLKKMNHDAQWVTYNEIDVTIRQLLSEGLDGVLHVHFEKEYLDMGVFEFYNTVCAHLDLAEFWFGARQSLGRGPKGSQTEIIKQARERGIRLRRLAQADTEKIGGKVRYYLSQGSPKQASQYTQFPLIRRKPLSDVEEVEVPWQPGDYWALPLTDANSFRDKAVSQKIKIAVQKIDDSLAKFSWPDPQMQYLTFIAGPKDDMVIAASTD